MSLDFLRLSSGSHTSTITAKTVLPGSGIFGATPRLAATLHASSNTPRHASHHARPRRVTPRSLDFDVFGGFWWFGFACFGGFVGLGTPYQFLSFSSDLLVFVDGFGGFGCFCLFLWFWWFLGRVALGHSLPFPLISIRFGDF
jgi:hypothetical protein